MLNVAVKAARRAGAIINRAAFDGTALTVRSKQANDFVTQVDQAAENAIIDIVRKAYPAHAILAEESGESPSASADYRWVIDPLDGTTNFIHGFPQYCVSIAVQHRGVIAHAVIYDPGRNELFTASRGHGAFLNDRRIRVAARTELADCVIVTGIPHRGKPGQDLFLREMEAVMSVTAGVRRTGAAALDLAWVAAGRFDGFWELKLKPWDVAAGALIVTEAGGRVTDLDGGDFRIDNGETVATNSLIHESMLAVLKLGRRAGHPPAGEADSR